MEVWNNQKQIDSEFYGPDPTYSTNEIYEQKLLDPTISHKHYNLVAKNIFNNHDSIWPLTGQESGTFYQIYKTINRPNYRNNKNELLYESTIL